MWRITALQADECVRAHEKRKGDTGVNGASMNTTQWAVAAGSLPTAQEERRLVTTVRAKVNEWNKRKGRLREKKHVWSISITLTTMIGNKSHRGWMGWSSGFDRP